MKNLKRLSAAIALTFVLGVSAFAGCEPPVPGQLETPCIPGQMPTPGDIDTPTVSSMTPGQIETPRDESETSFTAIAASLFESLLPIF